MLEDTMLQLQIVKIVGNISFYLVQTIRSSIQQTEEGISCMEKEKKNIEGIIYGSFPNVIVRIIHQP